MGTQDPGTNSVPGATGNPRPTRKSGVWGTHNRGEEKKERFLTSRTPFGMTVRLCWLPRWGAAVLRPYEERKNV
jgi:hypothetical protein